MAGSVFFVTNPAWKHSQMLIKAPIYTRQAQITNPERYSTGPPEFKTFCERATTNTSKDYHIVVTACNLVHYVSCVIVVPYCNTRLNSLLSYSAFFLAYSVAQLSAIF